MSTTIVHCKKEHYDLYIGRPGPWGNPWTHVDSKIAQFKVNTREEAVENHWRWLIGEDFTDILQDERQYILDNLYRLKDKRLGCWCKPKLCHGDNYKKLIEKLYK